MADESSKAHKSLTGSGGLEKKGGYPSPKTPVTKLPPLPEGPAPGAARMVTPVAPSPEPAPQAAR